MSKHQWTAVVRPNCKSFVLGDLGEVIAGTVEYPPNAYLLAASPDMLEALESARLWIPIHDRRDAQPILDQMDAAIAKAKGETA